MGTKNIPAIVMLSAGLVVSIVMYCNNYDLNTTLKYVLIAFVVFYLLGCFIKKILDKYCKIQPEEEESEEESAEEDKKEDEKKNQDGSVIEKK